MDTDKTEFELMVEQSAEALWEEFERTGSVKAYLLYSRKIQNQESFELSPVPSLR